MREIEQSKQLEDFWKKFKVFRPSPEVLKIYDNYIRSIAEKKDTNFMILGVTPELRMLVLRYDRKITAVDFSMIAINAMNGLMDYTLGDRDKETIVKCNWLNVPLERHSYDFILGDGSLNELENIGDYEQLLCKLKELLKPDGYFSTRIAILPDYWKSMTILDILKDFRGSSRGNNFSEDLAYGLIDRLRFYSEGYDEKAGMMVDNNIKKIDEFRRLYDHGEVAKVELELLLGLFNSIPPFLLERIRTFPKTQIIEELFTKYFTIISRIKDKDFPAYIYLLKIK